LNSRSSCFILPSAGITVVHHNIQQYVAVLASFLLLPTSPALPPLWTILKQNHVYHRILSICRNVETPLQWHINMLHGNYACLSLSLPIFFFFLWDWNLNSGLCSCKAGFYGLSHTSSPFCSGYFEVGCLPNHLPRLASNLHPPHLSLPSS
jgi:hypothetical protein